MDKYLQFNHLELSEDSSFIRWAKGSTSKDNLDWDGWLLRHPEKADLVAKAKSIVLAMKFVENKPQADREDKVWDKIMSDVRSNEQMSTELKSSKSLVRRILPYAAVAAIALLFFIMNWGSDYDTSYQVPYAKTQKINLPDGSIVEVNADSRLAFNQQTWDEERSVFLDGEAFFLVEKGSTFTVKTQDGQVEVLGTSFNVYNRNDQLQVHCETGKVAVKSAGKKTILTPAQSVSVVDRKHIFTENVSEMERRSAWRKGVFTYQAVEIETVAAELERQFDIKVELEDSILGTKYSGSFNRSNLETALTEVFYPLKLTYKKEGNTVIVTQ